MKVSVERQPWANMVNIYVSHDKHYAVYNEISDHIYPTEPGAEIRPYLSIDAMVYEGILREALGPTPTDDIVRDIRNTRDRMIVMLEKLVDEHISIGG